MSRRGFVGLTAAALVPPGPFQNQPRGPADDAVIAYLDARIPKRQWIEDFLDPTTRVWAKFDPELGYLLRNSLMRDGVDGSYTLARYQADGARQQAHFVDQPCRIHSYGNSFTQGHQVSDGETWQEVLAAHFGEPIRNFGIGGFGVYQAYRRLLRHESGESGAPFLLFNIFGDDHHRSIMAWRWLIFPAEVCASMGATMFHSNPWAHARLDDTGALVEKPNPCPTPESVLQLADREFVHEAFAGDDVTRLIVARIHPAQADRAVLERLAAQSGFKGLDLSSPAAVNQSATALMNHYAVRVGIAIFERLHTFATREGKRLFVLLSYPQGSIWNGLEGRPFNTSDHVDWHPTPFRQAMDRLGIPVFDSMAAHAEEFQSFRLDSKAYVDRYYIGHYNPRGNHFFAFAAKDLIRAWLDPAPPTYRGGDKDTLIRFQGYLPG